MAIEWFTGNEGGDIGIYEASSGASIVTGIAGMGGSRCLYVSAGFARKRVTARGEYYLTTLARPLSSGSGIALIGFSYNGTTIGHLYRTAANKLAVYRGLPGTLLETGSADCLGTTVYRLEVYYKPLASGGRFRVDIDGTTDIDYTGQTAAADSNIDAIDFGTSDGTAHFDNQVIDTAEFHGSGFSIIGSSPIGAGNATTWTPSSGTNYSCVDEVPISLTDYVYTQVVGDEDTYVIGAMPSGGMNVAGVMFHARMQRIGNPTAKNVQLVVRPASTSFYSASKNNGLPSRAISNVWTTNPESSVAWTKTDLESLKIGVKGMA